jgi:hypothetical protein
MKKHRIFMLFAAMALLSYSCKKDKDPGETTPEPVYSQFKAGTYWVYRHFAIDSAGNATATDDYDSCYVMKDTVINNLTYVKSYRGTAYRPIPMYDYSRDSLNYVVAPNGFILFSSKDFETVFYDKYTIINDTDTLYHAVKKMTDKDLPFTTPAGTFITSDCMETYTIFFTDTGGSPRYAHHRYAANIGIVCETLPFPASVPGYIERRLARYHIVL